MAGSPDQSDESFDFEDDEEMRSFWAVELVPGKEFTTQIPADLHITTAVLPASAKDAVRSVVSLSTDEDPEKSFAVVSLKLDSHESQTLDLMIDAGTAIKLTLGGSTKNHVHLSGYYVNLPGGEDFGSDDDEEGMFGDMEDEEDSDEEAEISPEMMKKLQELENKKRKVPQNGGEAAKKPKTEQANTPKKAESKPQQPKQQTPKGQAQPQAKSPQSGQKPAGQQAKAHPNGLQTTIMQEGSGAVATKGKKVGVKYVGRLTKTGKVFDASQKAPFVFKLGAREVITGWDLGVEGMKVGEKRKLVIPASLAYGAEGAGKDIPPNSSLTFDVELVNVK